jgi:type VI secretion system protein ImpF
MRMAKILTDQPLVPSVLDRLLDDDPTVSRETAKSRTQVLRELKQSVRRDLENLLNTRWRCEGWPEDLDQLDLSLVNYGIPDITGADLRSALGREQFRQILERVIRHFEPRFQRVSVEVLANKDSLDHSMRFRINAMMYAEPAPEPVVFDSALEPATGTVEVKGAGR